MLPTGRRLFRERFARMYGPRHLTEVPPRWRNAQTLGFALATALLATLMLPGRAAAWGFNVKERYQKSEHMVPMRDGVRLHTTVYSPRRSDEKFPFLLLRTPYGCPPYGSDFYRTHLGPSPHSFELGSQPHPCENLR